MFQKTANHRTHADVVGLAFHLRRQHAGATHNQVNLGALLASEHQRMDQGLVGQRIHLGHNAGRLAARGSFANRVDLPNESVVQLHGCEPQLVELGQAALAGKVTKNVFHVGTQQRVGSEVAEVGVQPCGARVVVAGRQVCVAAQLLALAAGDQQHLGMGFQADDAVDHLRANRLQHLGPVDVGLFVKARFQLHYRSDFLALAHRLAQQRHQLRVGTCAVDGLLDGQHLRVVHRFAQKSQYRIKTLERLVHEHIARPELLKKRLALSNLVGPVGLVRREQQFGRIHQVNELLQAHQVHRAVYAVQRTLRQIKLFQQKTGQVFGAPCRYLQPHCLTVVPQHQTFAQRGTQVLHVVLVHRQIGMACHAELRKLPHLAAGKQLGQMRADGAGQRHKHRLATRHLGRQPDQPRQHPRHLDDGDFVFAPEGVAPA